MRLGYHVSKRHRHLKPEKMAEMPVAPMHLINCFALIVRPSHIGRIAGHVTIDLSSAWFE